MFLLHLRNGRRGAACHQSSWRCLPTSQHDAAPLCGGVHVEVVNGLRMGRLASLQKPEATTPFQSSFSTRVGCECVAHVSHAFTDFTYCATVLSIAGVGSFDSASTAAMLRKLMNVVGGEASGSCCVALWEERIHIYIHLSFKVCVGGRVWPLQRPYVLQPCRAPGRTLSARLDQSQPGQDPTLKQRRRILCCDVARGFKRARRR